MRRNGKCEELRACPGVSRDAGELEAAVVEVVAQLARSVLGITNAGANVMSRPRLMACVTCLALASLRTIGRL